MTRSPSLFRGAYTQGLVAQMMGTKKNYPFPLEKLAFILFISKVIVEFLCLTMVAKIHYKS
jgi:hypothetical protein